MSVMLRKKKPEIALVGSFQSGKSTIFDTILEGRELSPCGVGIKTSACAITARALQSASEKEYVELQWRDSVELERFYATILETGSSAETDDGGLSRIATLIKRFNKSPAIDKWRRKSRVSLTVAKRLLTYPMNWEERWLKNSSGSAFKSSDVLFLFLQRAIFYVQCEMLKKMECDITDCPGFDAGGWDLALAEETMLRADGILCVINGQKGTMPLSYLDCLAWISNSRMSHKVMFVLNSHISRELAKSKWIPNIAASLRQKGFLVSDNGIKVFNAYMGLCARQLMTHEKSKKGWSVVVVRTLGLLMRREKISADELCQKRLITAMLEYLDIDVFDDTSKKKLSKDLKDYYEIWKESGFEEIVELLHQSSCRRTEDKKETNIWYHVDAEGLLSLNPGYVWKDNSSFLTQVGKGVEWNANIVHPSFNHILSQSEEGAWRPIPGYAWDGTRSDKSRKRDIKRVRWIPGMKHRDKDHVMADSEEGIWIPEKGYDWRNGASTESKLRYGVVWCSGIEFGEGKHLISSRTEGEWSKSPNRSTREIYLAFNGILDNNLYCSTAIPSTKLSNAKISMNVTAGEEVVVLFDATFWGGSREGFLITTKGVHAKELGYAYVFYGWDQIRSVSFSSATMWINSRSLNLPLIDNDLASHLNRALGTLIA